MVLQNKIVKDFQFSNNLALSVILNEGQGHQTKFWKRAIQGISQQDWQKNFPFCIIKVLF
jgi:hypothetical protein